MAINNEKLLREFGRNLKKLRLEKNLSTRKFANEADIAHSAVLKLEAGESNPTLTTLIKIANALDVSISDLLSNK